MPGEEKAMSMFPSNLEIHNYDISTLFIETRGWIRLLYRRMARGDGNIVTAYNNVVYMISQLWDAARLAIRRSGKIEKWDEKEKIYSKILEDVATGKFIPHTLIKFWEFLSEDIVDSGIYDEDKTSLMHIIARMIG